MSGSGRESATSAIRDLQFTHWPLRDDPLRSAVALVLILTISLAAGHFAESPLLGLAAAAAFFACLWRTWLPVRYEIGLRGILISIWGSGRRIPWRDIAVCEIGRRGIVLYPSPDRSTVASLRAWFIRYPPQRTQLLQLLDTVLARHNQRSASSVERLVADPSDTDTPRHSSMASSYSSSSATSADLPREEEGGGEEP